MKRYDIVIAGAGSVGMPLSYYCAKKGLKVAVIDREPSWGRGQNRAAIGGIRASHSDPAKMRICRESLDIASNFKEEHGIDIEWRRGGYLYVAYDEEHDRSLRELLAVQKSVGLDIDWIGPEKVGQLCPGISMEGLRGGTFSPEDGYASSLMTSTAFHKLALDAGVDFRFGEEVAGFGMDGTRITSMRTSKGEYQAGLFVDAAGAYGADVAALAGAHIPVRPDCHEAGVTEPVERFMEPMLVDLRTDPESANYYFYQATTGQLVFCITPKPSIWGVNKASTSTFLPLCVRRMLELYPRLGSLKVRRTWRGMYPMTPDGQPIIGYAREAENLLLAVGMCGQGYMIGIGLGRVLASVIADRTKEFDFIFEQLSPYRKFEGMEKLE